VDEDKAAIQQHYGTGYERERLADGSSRIEFTRTKELLGRSFLPRRPTSSTSAADQVPTRVGSPLRATGFTSSTCSYFTWSRPLPRPASPVKPLPSSWVTHATSLNPIRPLMRF
jgi:hypothetical protein